MFDSILSLRPYFYSLREIDNNVSLDIKLPVTWKFENIASLYKSLKIKVQDKSDRFTLVSFVSTATFEGYEVVFSCVKEVINTNKEMEEKQRLLESKIKELEILFKHEPIDKLRTITFIKDGEEKDSTSLGMVGEGEEEGRSGD